MSSGERITQEYIYRGRVVTLRIDTIRTDDGRHIRREIVEHRGAVAIVPMLDDQTVLLVRQYRAAADARLLEVPAGTLEPGEDPDDCAARELEEEVGYRAGRLDKLFRQYLAPGYSSEVLHVYVAHDLTLTACHPDEDEEIEVVPVSLLSVGALISDGTICDAKTIAALLMALHTSASAGALATSWAWPARQTPSS